MPTANVLSMILKNKENEAMKGNRKNNGKQVDTFTRDMSKKEGKGKLPVPV